MHEVQFSPYLLLSSVFAPISQEGNETFVIGRDQLQIW